MDGSSKQTFLNTLKINRWDVDFSEKTKIGRGGYASVYKAKNKFDGHFYAVKKIKLLMKDIKNNFERELERVLDEAKFLAEVNHQNVVRYYNSWLEATTKSPTQPKKFTKVPSEIRSVSEGIEDSGKFEESGDSMGIAFEKPGKSNNSSSDHLEIVLKYSKGEKRTHKLSDGFDGSLSEEQEDCDSPGTRIGGEIVDSICLYIQTELCDETLEEYITKRNQKLQKLKNQKSKDYTREKNLAYKVALNYAKQILNGVSEIHSHKIVHRDIKPGNIFKNGDTLKIGDFGLVKRLNNFSLLEASPLVEARKDDNLHLDGFKLDLQPSTPEKDRLPMLLFQKNISEPDKEPENEFVLEIQDSSITKSVGTRTFASPEQLKADREKFDYRADIFSLGITFLLLFHPMSTFMEQSQTIKECKKGKFPKEMELELPEISRMLKAMLADHPDERPKLEDISKGLVLPLEINLDHSGNVYMKRENSVNWREKAFKVMENQLFIFNNASDPKAESVYDLRSWKLFYIEGQNEADSQNRHPCIALENPMQMGCFLKASDLIQTQQLYNKFSSYCCSQELNVI